MTDTAPAAWMVANDPNLPAWQVDTLNALAAQGALYGVPPSVLAGIDQAESSGQGGAINSSGYGGFFGLGAGHTYPGGSPSSSLLETTTPGAFTAQAQIAASEFSSLLAKQGGDIYAAEKAYQGGSSEGDTVLASLGIPGGPGQAAGNPASTPAQTTSVVSAAAGTVAGALGLPWFGGSGSIMQDVLHVVLIFVFVAAGIGLILLGAGRLFPGVTTTIASTAGTAVGAAAKAP